MFFRRVLGVVAAAASLCAAIAVAPAAAGTYDVHACHLPSGAAAPLDGWSPAATSSNVSYGSSCADSGAGYMYAELRDDQTQAGGTDVFWNFRPPAGTAVVRARGHVEAWAGPHEPERVPHVRIDAGSKNLWNCTRPWDCEYRNEEVDFMDLPSVDRFWLQASCTGGQTCPSTTARKGGFRSRWWTVTLEDLHSPVASNADGTLVEGAVRHGTEAVTLQATDQGSGVRLLRIRLDGQVVAERTVDDNAGRCAHPFRHVVPCKLALGISSQYDTAAATDGRHSLAIEITDAAGNVTTAYGPRTHTFDNRPPVVGGVPEVAGEAVVGRPLECVTPAVDGQSPSWAYRWIRSAGDGSGRAVIAGATGRTYSPVAADQGRKLRCEVVATDMGGSSAAAESSLTSGPFADGGTVRPAPPEPRAGGGANGGDGGAGAPGGSVTVVSTGTSNGWVLDAFFTRNRTATATAAWGSAVELGGRVKEPGGAPVAGAQVEVLAKALGGERLLAATRTAGDGDWTARLPVRFASTRLVVRAKPLPTGAIKAAADLTLRVGAGIALRVTPGRVRPKGLIRFSGRLLGGPVPAKGKVIELRARSRGTKRWILFKTIRTTRSGAFRTSYRLRRGFRNITYEFQAMTREEAAYPYAAGTSTVRAVRVR